MCERPGRCPLSAAKVAAAAVSVMTLVSCLLGYGVSLGYEAVLGVPHSDLYRNVIDLLDLSASAYADLATAMARAIKIMTSGLGEFIKSVFLAGWQHSWFGLLLLLVFLALGVYFWLDRLFGRSARASVRSVLDDWRTRVLKQLKRQWVRIVISVVLGPVIFAALVWLELLAAAIAVLLFVLPTVVGYAAGSHQACQDVGGRPKVCATVRRHAVAAPESHLVLYIKGSAGPTSGYLVVSSPSAVLLWNRCQDSYALVPAGEIKLLTVEPGALTCAPSKPH